MLMNHDKEARRIPPAENPEKSATREHPESGPTMDHQHAKVERFLKLGYSHGDIVRVLESLRHDAQTNDILEELIKTCHSRTHGNHSNHGVPDSPKLVARGCSPNGGQPRAAPDRESASGFRPVVIDGSNVAMSHGDKKVFSCQGIQLAVNWFWDKGLRDITVFIPLWRKEPRPDALITDQHILHELERRKILVYTPSRSVNGKRVVCYDDRYIVKLAVDSDGIIVSNDNYRDLQTENPKWKKFIEERLLMYTFANDKFMPPDDPLGRNGPTIEDFLRKKLWTPENKLQHCPYGKKCTYGVKCKFYHPERVNQSQLSVADELRALSDRAKSFSPKPSLQEPHHALHTSTPPPLGVDDQSHRTSPGQRDTGSPRSQSSTGHHHWPSLDMDEAFSSMESSLSRLYIQEAPYSIELPTHSYSSGVASYSLGHDSYSLSSSFNGYNPHQQNGPVSGECPTCSGCRCQQTRISSHHHHHHPTWGSCPALPPLTKGTYSDKQCFGPPPTRQSHSLPRDPWLHGCRSDGRSTGSTKSLPSEQRNGLRSQLSTLFPQSTVEHLMNTYPHVSDMSELMALIQNNWTSCMTF